MAKRRGNNEGSLYQRPDGHWSAQVSVNGRRLTHSAATQRECREWLKETIAQVDDGLTAAGAKTTLATYFESWLEMIKPTVRVSTWDHYSRVTEHDILPRLGAIRLKDLRPDHVQALYTAQTQAGMAPRTVRLTHAILHRALGQALKLGLLRRNPADAVDKPKLGRDEIRTLNLEQAQALLAVAQGHRLETLLHLAINTGLRQGELLGLKWSDLDWKTGALQVQRQLQRLRGHGLGFIEPKTAAGCRSVIIGPGTLAKLREQSKRQKEDRLFMGAQWQEQGLIFTSTFGTPLDPSDVRRQFKQMLRASGLPDIRFHDLRHTAATLMLQQGTHPKIVQERLGHSKIGITLDVYSHVLPGMQQDAAERLDAALGDRRGKTAAELQQ